MTNDFEAEAAREFRAERERNERNGGPSKPKPKPPPRFRLTPFAELQPGDAPRYLVKPFVPAGGLTVVYGSPKCGKTFWTFDLAMHVALGWPYRGKPVLPGAVVYCAFEGAQGFRDRAEAFRRHTLNGHTEPVPLFLMAAPLNMQKDHKPLIGDIRAQLGDTQPVLVVLDTLNRSLGGSESKDEDMSAYIQAADAIRDAFGCAVIVVHHSGIDATRPRGHTALAGAVDAQLAVKRDAANNIIVVAEHMKDGPEGAANVSRLEPVELDLDEDGDPITSCLLVPVEGVTIEPKDRTKPLTKAAKVALSALHEVLGVSGEVPPESNYIPSNSKAVTVKQWREFTYRRGVSQSEEPRARQKAFERASEALVAARLIGIWEPWVWPV
ncbi:MAG: AAA family ATPase [Mesorhizobium sp.]|nr:MAG: AAA family ATPase [Mesorhizobium sp.]